LDQPIASEGNIVKDVGSCFFASKMKAFNPINIDVSNHRNFIFCVMTTVKCDKRVILCLTWKIYLFTYLFLWISGSFSRYRLIFCGGGGEGLNLLISAVIVGLLVWCNLATEQ
jgi:hypothetical protein